MSTTMEDLNLKRYGRLLARAVPKVIKTEEENERALAIVESLMEKGEGNMTVEEDALLELLTDLIHDFESRRNANSSHSNCLLKTCMDRVTRDSGSSSDDAMHRKSQCQEKYHKI